MRRRRRRRSKGTGGARLPLRVAGSDGGAAAAFLNSNLRGVPDLAADPGSNAAAAAAAAAPRAAEAILAMRVAARAAGDSPRPPLAALRAPTPPMPPIAAAAADEAEAGHESVADDGLADHGRSPVGFNTRPGTVPACL